MVDMFSGGAVQRMAIFALNVMPYISASIIVQLLGTVYPPWEKLRKEGGEAGRKQLNQYTRYLTVVLALFQSFGIAIGLSTARARDKPGPFFILSTVVDAHRRHHVPDVAGRADHRRGVGNGVSLIIFAGIVARLPTALSPAARPGAHRPCSAAPCCSSRCWPSVVIVFIVFMERSQRRLLVQYPKRQMGNRMFGGETSFLPLKLNISGVIPPIFASSAAGDAHTVSPSSPTQPAHLAAVAATGGRPAAARPADLHGRSTRLLIIFFSFFYTSVVFNAGGHGGEPAQVRRLPARHPARPAHGGIHRLCADPPDRDRRALHHRRLPAARGADGCKLGQQPAVRRHLDPDRGHGDHGHGGADPVAPAGAPVRGADQEIEAARAARRR